MFNEILREVDIKTLDCMSSCSKITELLHEYKVRTIKELQDIPDATKKLEWSCKQIAWHNFSLHWFTKCKDKDCSHELPYII